MSKGLLLVAAVLLGVAACGGGSKRLTKAELVSRGDAICTTLHQKNVALQRRAPQTSPTDPRATDAEVKRAGPILVQLAANLRDTRDELAQLKPPAAVEARWRDAMKQYGVIASSLAAAGRAATRVDRQGVVTAYQRALRDNSSLQGFERMYGFHVCGQASS